MILTLTLNPAWDKIIEHIPAGIKRESVWPAGKGINVSRTLSILGYPNKALILTGRDDVHKLEKALNQEGVAHELISRPGRNRQNENIVDERTKSQKFILEEVDKVDPKYFDAFVEHFKQVVKKAEFVVIGGSKPPGIPSDAYTKIMKICLQAKIPFILDAGHSLTSSDVYPPPTIIKPNLQEAETLLGQELKTMTARINALKDFKKLGIQDVFITLGKAGVLAADNKFIYEAKLNKEMGTDSVGSGDAFIAGFLFKKLKKHSFEDALSFAVACGAANTLIPGPGKIKREDLNQIIALIKIKKLKDLN